MGLTIHGSAQNMFICINIQEKIARSVHNFFDILSRVNGVLRLAFYEKITISDDF